MTTRKEQIAKRRKQISRLYKPVYDRAVKGRSLRAAINAQCLECVGWQRNEVRDCTDLACPLYAVRPYQSKKLRPPIKEAALAPESTREGKDDHLPQ